MVVRPMFCDSDGKLDPYKTATVTLELVNRQLNTLQIRIVCSATSVQTSILLKLSAAAHTVMDEYCILRRRKVQKIVCVLQQLSCS